MILPVLVTAVNLTTIHCVFQVYSLLKHHFLSKTIEILLLTSQSVTATILTGQKPHCSHTAEVASFRRDSLIKENVFTFMCKLHK